MLVNMRIQRDESFKPSRCYGIPAPVVFGDSVREIMYSEAAVRRWEAVKNKTIQKE